MDCQIKATTILQGLPKDTEIAKATAWAILDLANAIRELKGK